MTMTELSNTPRSITPVTTAKQTDDPTQGLPLSGDGPFTIQVSLDANKSPIFSHDSLNFFLDIQWTPGSRNFGGLFFIYDPEVIKSIQPKIPGAGLFMVNATSGNCTPGCVQSIPDSYPFTVTPAASPTTARDPFIHVTPPHQP